MRDKEVTFIGDFMAAGLQVFNDSNTVQVDSTWSNYALVEKFTALSIANPNTGTPLFDFGYRYMAGRDDDLVFVHCKSEFNLVGFNYTSGQRYLPVATYTSGVPITFYRFRQQPPTSSTYGLQVFNESGVLCFDALSHFARISLSVNGSYNNLLQSMSYGITPGREYALLIPSFTGQMVESYSGAGTGGMGWYYIDLYGPKLRCIVGGIQTTGGSYFARTQIPIQNPPSGVRVTNYQSSNLIVADITGF